MPDAQTLRWLTLPLTLNDRAGAQDEARSRTLATTDEAPSHRHTDGPPDTVAEVWADIRPGIAALRDQREHIRTLATRPIVARALAGEVALLERTALALAAQSEQWRRPMKPGLAVTAGQTTA